MGEGYRRVQELEMRVAELTELAGAYARDRELTC